MVTETAGNAQMEFVGIDVGAKELTVARGRGRDRALKSYANTPAGHRRLAKTLRAGDAARVCLEATGVYSLDLAFVLHKTPGLEIMVANPRATHNFAKALLQRSKTDLDDARMLADFAARMPFNAWTPPSAAALQVRDIARHMSALIQAAANEKNRHHAAKATATTPQAVLDCLGRHIDQLHAHIDALQASALEIIAADDELARRLRLLVSVPGIAERSALLILAELAPWPDDMTKRQWVAGAGLDVREIRSGTSVNRTPRISKQGNRRLRKALYMPALAAIRLDPNFKAFSQRLRDNGKKPLQAIVAVMRKLLHAIHGMFKNNTPFDSAKLFSQLNQT